MWPLRHCLGPVLAHLRRRRDRVGARGIGCFALDMNDGGVAVDGLTHARILDLPSNFAGVCGGREQFLQHDKLLGNSVQLGQRILPQDFLGGGPLGRLVGRLEPDDGAGRATFGGAFGGPVHSVRKRTVANWPSRRIRPGGASATHLPQAVQATSHEASAVSPSALFLQAIQRRWLIGSSEKRPFGQTSTQSLQAEHLSASTTGRPWASRCKASKWQTTSQSPKPRQPQAHSLPPPPTTAAARQVLSPA